MVVVVIVLTVVAGAAVVMALVNRRWLVAQRALTRDAEERSTVLIDQVAAESAAVETATRQRVAAEDLAARRAEQARLAEARASATDIAVWILEQARSERTWRFSVAPGPDSVSMFAEATPLMAALQVELDAAREDVGAVVELDAEIPDGLTVAAMLLALRAAQELVADVVRRSEETTLGVHVDGPDLVVDVDSVDENGNQVLPLPLPIPPSPAVEITSTGVRIRDAFALGVSDT